MTTRQILATLRSNNSKSIYKTVSDRETGRRMIVSRPDFDAVPYDANCDFWAFVAWADTAATDLRMHGGLELVGKNQFAPSNEVLHIRQIGSPSVLCGQPLTLQGRGEYDWHAAGVRADFDPANLDGVCKACARRV